MSIALLDVNVIIALADPEHIHHDLAHRWFVSNRRFGWAACPMTLNGFVRIRSNPSYPKTKVSATELLELSAVLCASADHYFWPDSISLLDTNLFKPSAIRRSQDITDIYLLGLAVRNHGKLATFDRSIPINAVVGATPRHLAVIPSR